MKKDISVAHLLIIVGALISVSGLISSALALLLGLAIALTFGNPFTDLVKTWTHRLLALSVVGLGAGMNLGVVARVGINAIGYTFIGIVSAVVIGTFLGRMLKTDRNTSLLITIGTAICGGSAIAAVSPVLGTKQTEISVSLGIVFMLNAVALFLFPWVGHHLSLSETQFGLWSALAIHDTSSVVGATMQYGLQALQIGTTAKLARALWIIPVVIIIGFMKARENKRNAVSAPAGKAKRPWFILGFLIAAALVTWVPQLQDAGHLVENLAKHLMVLTLFLIGSSLTRTTVKSVGLMPFVQGISLWVIMASGSLAAIYYNVIR